MATNNLQFNFCYQKARQQSFAIAPVRTEIQQTPYIVDSNTNKLKYTPSQLDMRRKTEILKYKPNVQSNQTNNLTKKEVYTLIVNGRFTRTNFPPARDGNTTVCPNDELIPTPTSSCGVPGPIMYLIDDESVPLYNYATRDQVFNLVDAVNVPSFSITDLSNQILYYSSTTPIYTTISSIYFRGIINKMKTINLNIPIGISLQGNVITGSINENSLPTSANVIDIKNISFDVDVFYENIMIDTTPTITMNNKLLSSSQTFDLSFSVTNLTSGNLFNSTNYIGNMNIQNLSVYVGSGSIFDIKLIIKSYNPSVSNLVNLNDLYFIGNYTTIDTSNNCIINANSISNTRTLFNSVIS
jgi:hypothetical protein